jgi:F-type H+-transporting ATPase subunit b
MNNILILGAEAGARNSVHLPHDINELYWGSLAFFLVVGLLWWKAGPAIKGAWNGRIERIEGELKAAGDVRVNAEAELAAVRERIANADAERARILAEATETAASLKAQLIERAGIEAAEVSARAAADVDASRSQAMADLSHEVSALAMGAAEQVVRSNLDDATQQQLVEAYITQVGASS